MNEKATPHPLHLVDATRIAVPGVVVHLDENGEDKHEAVLRNISHLLDEVSHTTVIELVAHGPGIHAVVAGASTAVALRELHARGVRLVACENTLTRMGIDRTELAAGVSTVPSGLGELVRRQSEGWAYVRP